MAWLVLGLFLFLVPHQLKAYAPNLRESLLARYGEKRFKGVYSLIALLGLILIVLGYRSAEYIWLWQPLPGSPFVTHGLMLLAVAFLVAPKMPNSWGKAVKHPMLVGIFLWGVAHLWLNGHVKGVLLFAGFALYALSNGVRQNWQMPLKPVALWQNLLWLVVSVLAYGVIRYIHVLLAG